MQKYKTGIMSSVIELIAGSKDEAICVSMLYFNSQAPIAVYDCDEKGTLQFPYSPEEVDKILGGMGERLKVSFHSIHKVQ